MSRLARWRARWEALWFVPEPPHALAAARIVFALQALWILLSRDIPALSGLPREFWAEVGGGARWRYLLWEGHPGLEAALQAVALVALIGVLVGVRARACCALAGLLLYHLAPLETLFYTPSPWAKGLTLPVLGLIVLSVSPCDAALALWPARGSGAEPRSGVSPRGPSAGIDFRREPPNAPWEYGWPLRLLQLFVAQPYLFSGWSKLMHAGWSWASGQNIRAWLLLSNQDDQLAVFTAPGLWVADRPWLCLLMGAAALLFDLCFVAAVFWRPSRRVLVPAAFAFHLGVLVTQNYFFLYMPLLLVFVDWRAFGGGRAQR